MQNWSIETNSTARKNAQPLPIHANYHTSGPNLPSTSPATSIKCESTDYDYESNSLRQDSDKQQYFKNMVEYKLKATNSLHFASTMNKHPSSDEENEYIFENTENRSDTTYEENGLNNNHKKESSNHFEEYDDDEYYTDESESERLHMSTNLNKHKSDSSSKSFRVKDHVTFNANHNPNDNEKIYGETNAKNNSNTSARSTGLICVVCGAAANGYNFDRITCESCKAFFRRNAFRPLVSDLRFELIIPIFSVMKCDKHIYDAYLR